MEKVVEGAGCEEEGGWWGAEVVIAAAPHTWAAVRRLGDARHEQQHCGRPLCCWRVCVCVMRRVSVLLLPCAALLPACAALLRVPRADLLQRPQHLMQPVLIINIVSGPGHHARARARACVGAWAGPLRGCGCELCAGSAGSVSGDACCRVWCVYTRV
jgi:hypothetical protein